MPGTTSKSHQHTWTPPEESFFQDNQISLSSAALPKKKSEAQHLQLKLYPQLQRWTNLSPIFLYWCPGNVGIPENEKIQQVSQAL
ncbi:hypothetical protein O181_010850 [Austropuccinia psidii MF-1]|uniref:Uncharacterized protein n=1 Tax=Austropuccinia psidii MF-1 TaxID=1389203 RepID=A0A9Q3BUR7_9BASI|nr:hypothetical protein [Austropuccinia psidii MF-1]